MLVQHKNGVIYNLNEERPGNSPITLITRPFSGLQPDTYIRINQLYLRMYCSWAILTFAIAAAHDADGEYKIVHSFNYQGKIDGYLPIRLTIPPFKSYRLIMTGVVSKDFYLDCADIAYNTINNNKLR